MRAPLLGIPNPNNKENNILENIAYLWELSGTGDAGIRSGM